MDPLAYKLLRRKRKVLREKSERSFDSSSIGDIAFLLLIFFIVTGSFLLRQGLFLSLPSKSAGAIKMKENAFFEITPLKKKFQYQSRIVNRNEFKKLLINHKKQYKKTILVIQMKKEIKYDRLVDTLSISKEVGGVDVSIKNADGGT